MMLDVCANGCVGYLIACNSSPIFELHGMWAGHVLGQGRGFCDPVSQWDDGRAAVFFG